MKYKQKTENTFGSLLCENSFCLLLLQIKPRQVNLDLDLVEPEMPSWTNCSLIDGSGIKLQQTGIKLQITGSNKVCNTALLPMLPLLLGDKWEVAGL